jgi:hypothetical protein
MIKESPMEAKATKQKEKSMPTIRKIPIWERTVMATYLMNYWGMDHCVHPNNKKHNTNKLLCRQLFNPNIQVDPPSQTSTDKC